MTASVLLFFPLDLTQKKFFGVTENDNFKNNFTVPQFFFSFRIASQYLVNDKFSAILDNFLKHVFPFDMMHSHRYRLRDLQSDQLVYKLTNKYICASISPDIVVTSTEQ